MLPTALRDPPAGLEPARALIQGLDDALMAGFARLGPNHKERLDQLGAAMAPSPLGPAVSAAVSAIRSGPPAEEHLVALAAAREALQGAVHDALLSQALTLLGRPAEIPTPATTITTTGGDSGPLTASARQWLTELALGGLVQANPANVQPFLPNLERIQEDKALGRESALLTGFYDELMDLLPLQSPDQAPVTRWGDLWARSLLGLTGRVERAEGTSEKGRFSCFAVEIRHHAHLVSAVLWGLWEPAGGTARTARCTLSGWRVPAIAGPESWHALRGAFGPLLQAVAGRLAWDAEATVLTTGDLRFKGGRPGPAVDGMGTAKRAMGAEPPVSLATDRHPVQIALPVLFEVAPTAKGSTVAFGDGELPVSFNRVSALSGLDASTLCNCNRWVGLLGWDDGTWSVRPLAGVGGKKPADVGPLEVLAVELKGSSEALGNLRERAGKLLRQKS